MKGWIEVTSLYDGRRQLFHVRHILGFEDKMILFARTHANGEFVFAHVQESQEELKQLIKEAADE